MCNKKIASLDAQLRGFWVDCVTFLVCVSRKKYTYFISWRLLPRLEKQTKIFWFGKGYIHIWIVVTRHVLFTRFPIHIFSKKKRDCEEIRLFLPFHDNGALCSLTITTNLLNKYKIRMYAQQWKRRELLKRGNSLCRPCVKIGGFKQIVDTYWQSLNKSQQTGKRGKTNYIGNWNIYDCIWNVLSHE